MSKKIVKRKVQPLKKVKYNIPIKQKVKRSTKKVVHQLNSVEPLPKTELLETPNIQILHTENNSSMLQSNETLENIKTETQSVVTSTGEIKTQDSNSMLDDLMSETDKDNEPVNENENSNDLFNELESESKEPSTISDSVKPKVDDFLNPETQDKNLTDKLHDTLTSDGEDWQNHSDFRKMCAVNAMMYVEGGAILLSFIGQMISGDWTPEGEKKYTPSEERRKLIRNPLAKKLELSKDRSKSTPTGAMITAIIFTILPIVIIAFKDRKQRIKNEAMNIENLRLKKDLEAQNAELTILRNSAVVNTNPNANMVAKNPSSFIIKQRGRHKKDCPCDKCNLKKMKSK